MFNSPSWYMVSLSICHLWFSHFYVLLQTCSTKCNHIGGVMDNVHIGGVMDSVLVSSAVNHDLSFGRVKQKTIKLVFVASPLSIKDKERRMIGSNQLLSFC